jgi:addiction module RelE/StbE family toxin
MRIEWLPAAIDGLERQIDYIEMRNPTAAIRCSRRVEKAVGRLLDHPEAGRVGRIPGTRELVVTRTPFLIVYRVEQNAVVVLRLFHVAQDRAAVN